MSNDTTESTVVIGAAGGLGRIIARRLGREPWCGKLIVSDLDEARLDDLAGELREAGVADVATHVADASDPASIEALVRASGDARRVCVTVGVMVPSVSALETTAVDFETTLAVNLTGAFILSQAYARAMIERGVHGSIVGISSIGGIVPRWHQAAYSASKAGLQMALRVLGLETAANGVRVNVVSPGGIDTPMSRGWRERNPGVDQASGSLETFRTRVPVGHIGNCEDVAAAVAFLLGPDSGHVVMRDLVVDGGELLGV
jgi:2,3-dihydro-2,3-dihydroxybenzoate dehydrogenase